MAIAETAVWEFRSAGAANNGGGFNPALGGVDYSQQDAPQLILTDVVGNNTTTLTSAIGGFTSQMVGNVFNLNVGGGENWFEIKTVPDTNTITIDRTTGTFTGGTVRVGGGILLDQNSIPLISNSHIVPGMQGFFTGTFDNIRVNAILLSVSGTAAKPIIWTGYQSVRGDGGKATFKWALSTINVMELTGNNQVLKNFTLDGHTGAGIALLVSGNGCTVENVTCQNQAPCKVTGGSNTFRRCQFINSDGGADNLEVTGGNNLFEYCDIYGSSGHGVDFNVNNKFINCLIYDNTNDGFTYEAGDTFGSSIRFCDVWGNGRDGIRLASSANDGGLTGILIECNILGDNVGYEVNYTPSDVSTGAVVEEWVKTNFRHNAFYSTGSGAVNQLPDDPEAVTLGSDPFTDSASGDFSLNTVADGGVLILDDPEVVDFPDGVNTGTYVLGALGGTGTTTPTAPSGLTGVEISTGVLLTWVDNSSNEVNFTVERSDNGGGFAVIDTLAADTVSTTDTTVAPGNTYSYRVKAVNLVGSSTYTNTVTLTTSGGSSDVPAVPDIDEVRFPPGISRGAVGGDVFATIVVAGSTGAEQRNENWDLPRMEWEVSHGLRTPEEGRELKAFFLNRRGKARGFRFKNWDDYEATNETLQQTGAKTVQLIKTYSDGVFDFIRYIFKPTEDFTPFTMRRNGVAFTDFTLDETTGVVTLDPDASFNISAITKASQAVITVTGHTYSIGESVYIEGVNGMTQINGQTVVIVGTGASTITVALDTTAYSTYTSGGTAAQYVQPGEVLDWSGEFDIPARFDTDKMRLSLSDSFIREWMDVPVVELTA